MSCQQIEWLTIAQEYAFLRILGACFLSWQDTENAYEHSKNAYEHLRISCDHCEQRPNCIICKHILLGVRAA